MTRRIHTVLVGGPYDGGSVSIPDTVPPLPFILIRPGKREDFGVPTVEARYWRTLSGKFHYNPPQAEQPA